MRYGSKVLFEDVSVAFVPGQMCIRDRFMHLAVVSALLVGHLSAEKAE